MAQAHGVTQADRESVFIIGAGHAGGELAIALRQQGCAASIVVIGEECHPPYQRPPLSKACLKGEADPTSLYLKQQTAYERSNVGLILNARVERIDPQARMITLADGRELSYTKLALATGARAKALDQRRTAYGARQKLSLPADDRRCCEYPRRVRDRTASGHHRRRVHRS